MNTNKSQVSQLPPLMTKQVQEKSFIYEINNIMIQYKPIELMVTLCGMCEEQYSIHIQVSFISSDNLHIFHLDLFY